MKRHNEPMQATDYVVEWDDGVPGLWLKCRICDPKAGGQKGWLPIDDKWLGEPTLDYLLNLAQEHHLRERFGEGDG